MFGVVGVVGVGVPIVAVTVVAVVVVTVVVVFVIVVDVVDVKCQRRGHIIFPNRTFLCSSSFLALAVK